MGFEFLTRSLAGDDTTRRPRNFIDAPTRRLPVIGRLRSLPLLALVALAACGQGGSAGEGPDAEAAPVQGGTAIVSRISDFDAFNQFVSTDYDTSQTLRHMLFMPLVALDRSEERRVG